MAEAIRRYPDKMIGGDVHCIRRAFIDDWMLCGETHAALFGGDGESA